LAICLVEIHSTIGPLSLGEMPAALLYLSGTGVISVAAQRDLSASSSRPKEQLTYKHSLHFDVDEQATKSGTSSAGE
jgi:hypothetical protein